MVCSDPGWKPSSFGLKDHTIFRYDGSYYLASIYLSTDHWEDRFAYARSADLCHWEDLGPILTDRQPGAWDEFRVWAPFVIEEGGIYYLYYTGVTSGMTQSILLATSTNPADPGSWQPRGMVFQPSHSDAVWPGRGYWSDARDPMVLQAAGRYYLYFTGRDRDGGIVGAATADRLMGPWHDSGPILTIPGTMLESSGVIAYSGWYYLFYNRTLDGTGPQLRVGVSPVGPWSSPRPLAPGWAHEFWVADDGSWMTSYLTDYSVTIRPVAWDHVSKPPQPFIGEHVWHTWLPAAAKLP